MSILQQNFTRAAYTHTWDEALLYANRLKMYEMLQAFDALPPTMQDDLIEFLKSLQVLPPGSKSLVVDEHGNPKDWPPLTDASEKER